MTLQLQLYNTQHSFEPKYKAPYERPHTGTVRSEYAQKKKSLVPWSWSNFSSNLMKRLCNKQIKPET